MHIETRVESNNKFLRPIFKGTEVIKTATAIANVVNTAVGKHPDTDKQGATLHKFNVNPDLFAVKLAEFIADYVRELAIEALRNRKPRANAAGQPVVVEEVVEM